MTTRKWCHVRLQVYNHATPLAPSSTEIQAFHKYDSAPYLDFHNPIVKSCNLRNWKFWTCDLDPPDSTCCSQFNGKNLNQSENNNSRHMLLILNRPRELTEQYKNTCMRIHISQATGLKIRFFFRISNWSLMCSFNFQALALAMRGLAMWMATLLGTASDGIVENFGPICCFLHDDHYRLYGIGCLFDEEHFFFCVCA